MVRPQQPEVARGGRNPTDPDFATHRDADELPDRGPTGPVPEENRPGHHPEHEQDKPQMRVRTGEPAERTPRRSEQGASMAEDEIREPDNSTVDDWLGQRVGRDEERAERLLDETGGDEAEAAARFDRESEAQEWDEAHIQDE